MSVRDSHEFEPKQKHTAVKAAGTNTIASTVRVLTTRASLLDLSDKCTIAEVLRLVIAVLVLLNSPFLIETVSLSCHWSEHGWIID